LWKEGRDNIRAKWPVMGGEEVCRKLEVASEKGLSPAQAAQRQNKYGKNSFQKGDTKSPLIIFMSQFGDFLILVLLAATLVSALLGEYVDGITIMAILFLNAVLGTVQEYRAERSLKALRELAAPRTSVIREGRRMGVNSEEIVPGDVVILDPGDRVGADLRLLEAQGLLIDEAPLTGESVPSSKSETALSSVPSSPGDTSNMVYGGTLVVEGRGRGVVVATGDDSQLGKIAHLMEQVNPQLTPLQKRLERLGKYLVAACMAVCFLVMVLGVWRGETVYHMFMAGVSLAVAAIPEGLPAIVTVSLALGVQRMIKRRAIVRQLPAVETLGSATVICSDKTGTLTRNRMVLKEVFTGGELYFKEEDAPWKKSSRGAVNPAGKNNLSLALKIGLLCNNALFNPSQGKETRTNGNFIGDPTEVALAEAARDAGIKWRENRLQEFSFTPERKRMSVLIRGERKHRLLVKGAPEVIINQCRYIYKNGEIKPLGKLERKIIRDTFERMAGTSLRSLAVAYRDFKPGKGPVTAEEAERELVWVGLMGMEDPPRAEVPSAVNLCHRAGVKVVMITGDHRNTALSIARKLGIIRKGKVLTGDELDQLDDSSLSKIIEDIHVFARVDPSHKLRLVRAFKSKGHVVAMTGDGVNDAPAVKEADIGIAMGSTGTEVTKEAASLVLEDDNFSTIVAAVEEGRNIYSNIRKFIRFLLGCNSGEIITMLLAILIGLPLPLRPIQILWVNLVTDGLPALALGVEEPDREIMNAPPRKKEENLFDRHTWFKLVLKGLLIGAATLAVFTITLFNHGDLVLAQTAALASLVVTQLVFVFDCRSERVSFEEANKKPNYYLYAAVVISFLLLLMVVYCDFWQGIFQTSPLGVREWLYIAGFSLLPYLVPWYSQERLQARAHVEP